VVGKDCCDLLSRRERETEIDDPAGGLGARGAPERVADVARLALRGQDDEAPAGPLEDVRYVLDPAADELVAAAADHERLVAFPRHRLAKRSVPARALRRRAPVCEPR